MSATDRHAEFPATKWSVVQRAAAVSSQTSRAALEDLCRTYWPPLYAFLRRSGHDPAEAKDLVQGYLARLLARDDLAAVAPSKGRFRSYLLAGLRNHLVSERRKEGAQKRGGDSLVLSLDTENAESLYNAAVAAGEGPDLAFDRRWAETILDRALDALRLEHLARGKSRLYETLKGCLAQHSADHYDTLSETLGMTRGAIAVAVHRLRLRLRELVRAEVAQTVGSASDLEEEMRNLFTILSQ